MNKKVCTILLNTAITMSLLTGCGSKGNSNDTLLTDNDLVTTQDSSKEESNNSTTPQPTTTEDNSTVGEGNESSDHTSNTEQENTQDNSETTTPEPTEEPQKSKAVQAYMDFLNGNSKLKTSERFRTDNTEWYYDGLIYGEYSLLELKAKIAELEMSDSTIEYTILDLGNDGTEALFLCFKSLDTSFNNWTGIINYNENGLNLIDFYEDGYRTDSVLYQSGYLQIGGSFGAGAGGYDIDYFDSEGNRHNLYSSNYYFASFATEIGYHLQEDGLSNDYYELFESDLTVSEYMAGSTVKIAVDSWSEDEDTVKIEEQLIDDLVSLGAELITSEEMIQVVDSHTYDKTPVEWTSWYIEGTAPIASSGGQLMTADYAPADLTTYPIYTNQTDENSENLVHISLEALETVTEVQVLTLNVTDVDENGTLLCNPETLYYQRALMPDRDPLVIAMTFPGTIPNIGVSFIDGIGKYHIYAIEMSGKDGSILLTNVKCLY